MNVSLDSSVADPTPSDRTAHELPTLLTIVVAGLTLGASVAGLSLDAPLVHGPSPVRAFVAQDLTSLLVAVPLLVGSLRLARRHSLAGQLLWMGALLHVASTHAVYVLGTRFSALLPVYVAVVAASMYALIDLVVDVDADAVKAAFGRRAPTRAVGAFLVAAAAALVFSSNPGSPLGLAPATAHPLVESLDLALLIPTILAAGALLWRRRPWGFVLAGVLLPKVALIGLTAAISAAPSLPRLSAVALAAVGAVAAGSYLRTIERGAAPLPSLGA